MDKEPKEEINLIDSMHELFTEDNIKKEKKIKRIAIILTSIFLVVGITIGIFEYLKEDKVIDIGDLGIKKTHIAANENYNEVLSLNIKTDGVVTAKNERTGKALVVKGIEEKAISMVKTYNEDNVKKFNIIILTEKGNIYAYNIDNFNNNINYITFNKIKTDIVFYGIEVISNTKLVGYDKDKIMYKIDYKDNKWEVK